jgi:hypothetical protein
VIKPWAKLLMITEAVVSLVIAGLVIDHAVRLAVGSRPACADRSAIGQDLVACGAPAI